MAARRCRVGCNPHTFSRDERCVGLRAEADSIVRTETGTTNPIVTDDFGDPVPTCDRELDAIERYLGAEIDQLLRLCK